MISFAFSFFYSSTMLNYPLADLDTRREQNKEAADAACKEQGCHFFEMSAKDSTGVQQPLHLLTSLIDQMVDSLIRKKYPIPRAKPKQADTMPSSLLARSAEVLRAEAKARALEEAKQLALEKEKILAGGVDEVKEGTVGAPGSQSAISTPRNWWEGSPYVKKVGEECI